MGQVSSLNIKLGHLISTALEAMHISAYNARVSYEWDTKKAAINLRKHGVDFADAISALEDELALTLDDGHPDEQRFVTIGTDAFARVLVVVYTFRGKKYGLFQHARQHLVNADNTLRSYEKGIRFQQRSSRGGC